MIMRERSNGITGCIFGGIQKSNRSQKGQLHFIRNRINRLIRVDLFIGNGNHSEAIIVQGIGL